MTLTLTLTLTRHIRDMVKRGGKVRVRVGVRVRVRVRVRGRGRGRVGVRPYPYPYPNPNQAPPRYDVFLSHNWGEGAHEKMVKLNEALKVRGLTCFLDQDNFDRWGGGGDLPAQMTQALYPNHNPNPNPNPNPDPDPDPDPSPNPNPNQLWQQSATKAKLFQKVRARVS